MAGERQFRRVLREIIGKEIIIPRLRTFLFDPHFREITIQLDGWSGRPPDGWFHPSTHPSWTERQLYYYLLNPEGVTPEPFELSSVLAITQGTFWHSFLLGIMVEAGILSHNEVYVEDPVLKSRGSMDGLLDVDNLPITEPESLELKTMRGSIMQGCPKGPPDDPAKQAWFKIKHLTYYLQAQEYMRMANIARHRVLIIGIESPFPMIELVVPYSFTDAMFTADKYKRVIQAVADRIPPDPCCSYGSPTAKVCPVRLSCPIGLGNVPFIDRGTTPNGHIDVDLDIQPTQPFIPEYFPWWEGLVP